MLISIIVPIYKVENYIHRCIDSILAQSYMSFELILVDDGSPDNCGAICDEYAKTDKRIRVIHKKNGGLSDARNAGLGIAKGEYVLFVDSDDYIEKNTLSTIYENIDTNTSLLNFGYYFEQDNKVCWVNAHQNKCYSLEKDDDRLRYICNELTDFIVPWNAWCNVFKRDIIVKYQLHFFDNKVVFAEDLFFMLCYVAHAVRIKVVDASLYHYCMRSESIMGIEKERQNIIRFENLANQVHEYYKKHDSCNYLLKRFPLIYYKIIKHAYSQDYQFQKINNVKLKKEYLYSQIYDKKKFREYSEYSIRHKGYFLNSYSSQRYSFESLSLFRYYATGNSFSLKIRLLVYKILYNIRVIS